ncbi:hypothetical protein T439DRAFT_376190 [Meredithblackwellia eburnea MCA 4105]
MESQTPAQRSLALLNAIGFLSEDELEDFIIRHGTGKVIPSNSSTSETQPLTHQDHVDPSKYNEKKRNLEWATAENKQLRRDNAFIQAENDKLKAEVQDWKKSHKSAWEIIDQLGLSNKQLRRMLAARDLELQESDEGYDQGYQEIQEEKEKGSEDEDEQELDQPLADDEEVQGGAPIPDNSPLTMTKSLPERVTAKRQVSNEDHPSPAPEFRSSALPPRSQRTASVAPTPPTSTRRSSSRVPIATTTPAQPAPSVLPPSATTILSSSKSINHPPSIVTPAQPQRNTLQSLPPASTVLVPSTSQVQLETSDEPPVPPRTQRQATQQANYPYLLKSYLDVRKDLLEAESRTLSRKRYLEKIAREIPETGEGEPDLVGEDEFPDFPETLEGIENGDVEELYRTLKDAKMRVEERRFKWRRWSDVVKGAVAEAQKEEVRARGMGQLKLEGESGAPMKVQRKMRKVPGTGTGSGTGPAGGSGTPASVRRSPRKHQSSTPVADLQPSSSSVSKRPRLAPPSSSLTSTTIPSSTIEQAAAPSSFPSHKHPYPTTLIPTVPRRTSPRKSLIPSNAKAIPTPHPNSQRTETSASPNRQQSGDGVPTSQDPALQATPVKSRKPFMLFGAEESQTAGIVLAAYGLTTVRRKGVVPGSGKGPGKGAPGAEAESSGKAGTRSSDPMRKKADNLALTEREDGDKEEDEDEEPSTLDESDPPFVPGGPLPLRSPKRQTRILPLRSQSDLAVNPTNEPFSSPDSNENDPFLPTSQPQISALPPPFLTIPPSQSPRPAPPTSKSTTTNNVSLSKDLALELPPPSQRPRRSPPRAPAPVTMSGSNIASPNRAVSAQGKKRKDSSSSDTGYGFGLLFDVTPPEPAPDWDEVERSEREKKKARPPRTHASEVPSSLRVRRKRARDEDSTEYGGEEEEKTSKSTKNVPVKKRKTDSGPAVRPVQRLLEEEDRRELAQKREKEKEKSKKRGKKDKVRLSAVGDLENFVKDEEEAIDLSLAPDDKTVVEWLYKKRVKANNARNSLKASGSKSTLELNPERNNGEKHAYHETVRNKEARKKMLGQACDDCLAYYERAGGNTTLKCNHKNSPNYLDTRQEQLDKISRHRVHQQPAPDPYDYWEMGFPSTQRTNVINREAQQQREQTRAYQLKEANNENGRYRWAHQRP